MKHNLIVFFCGFAFLLLSGCRQQNSLDDLKHYLDTSKKQPAIPIAKLPDFHLRSVTKTDSKKHRDPFVAKTIRLSSVEQLQQYALADLKLVGTLMQQQHRLALLQTPQRIVSVKEGQIIGTETAKIIAIMPTYIKLHSINGNLILKLAH